MARLSLILYYLPLWVFLSAMSQCAIPTISLQHCSSDELSRSILEACTSSGFFYLTHFPIPSDLVQDAWDAAEKLFLDRGDLTLQEQRLASRDRLGHTGYTAL